MATIHDIPTASDLQIQLDALLRAIYHLNNGSTVTEMTVSAIEMPEPKLPDPTDPMADPPETSMLFPIPIHLLLDPPISNPDTIAALILGMQAQADAIVQQLVSMGYETPTTPVTSETIRSWSRMLPQHSMHRERLSVLNRLSSRESTR